jgi:hypothetical protein
VVGGAYPVAKLVDCDDHGFFLPTHNLNTLVALAVFCFCSAWDPLVVKKKLC